MGGLSAVVPLGGVVGAVAGAVVGGLVAAAGGRGRGHGRAGAGSGRGAGGLRAGRVRAARCYSAVGGYAWSSM